MKGSWAAFAASAWTRSRDDAAPLLAALECGRGAEIASRAFAAIASEGRDPAAALVAALEGDDLDPELEEYGDDLQDAVETLLGFFIAERLQLAQAL